MSASDAFENALLKNILQNVAIANVGDATGLPGSATAGSLWAELHTADPGEAGNQSTNEVNYTGYARVPVVRSAAGWTVVGGAFSNAAIITFGKATAGSSTATHFSIGTSASGAGMILLSGALTASLTIASPITPSFAIGDLSGTVD